MLNMYTLSPPPSSLRNLNGSFKASGNEAGEINTTSLS